MAATVLRVGHLACRLSSSGAARRMMPVSSGYDFVFDGTASRALVELSLTLGVTMSGGFRPVLKLLRFWHT